jgi:hypothetical protein
VGYTDVCCVYLSLAIFLVSRLQARHRFGIAEKHGGNRFLERWSTASINAGNRIVCDKTHEGCDYDDTGAPTTRASSCSPIGDTAIR